MSKEISMPKSQLPNAADGSGTRSEKVYDLEERTARFGEAIVRFAKKIPVTLVTQPMIGQLPASVQTTAKPTTPAPARSSDTGSVCASANRARASIGCG